LTFLVVLSLTLYTFWAAKRGHGMSFLGPFLFAATFILVLYDLVQVSCLSHDLASSVSLMNTPLFLLNLLLPACSSCCRWGKWRPPSTGASGRWSIFSGCIIYDTDNLIKRHSYDEYVVAAISLYLDVINIFMYIVTCLTSSD
jgi:protein lifeguard